MAFENFAKDFLMDELGLPYDGVVSRKAVDQGRWTTYYEIVFEHPNGKFYRTWYESGSTEMQEVTPWEDEDTIRCEEVEEKRVEVVRWMPV